MCAESLQIPVKFFLSHHFQFQTDNNQKIIVGTSHYPDPLANHMKLFQCQRMQISVDNKMVLIHGRSCYSPAGGVIYFQLENYFVAFVRVLAPVGV